MDYDDIKDQLEVLIKDRFSIKPRQLGAGLWTEDIDRMLRRHEDVFWRALDAPQGPAFPAITFADDPNVGAHPVPASERSRWEAVFPPPRPIREQPLEITQEPFNTERVATFWS